MGEAKDKKHSRERLAPLSPSPEAVALHIKDEYGSFMSDDCHDDSHDDSHDEPFDKTCESMRECTLGQFANVCTKCNAHIPRDRAGAGCEPSDMGNCVYCGGYECVMAVPILTEFALLGATPCVVEKSKDEEGLAEASRAPAQQASR